MAELANVNLSSEIKAFGGRVFELTRPLGGELARAVRRAAADASRAYVRAVGQADARRARRALELAFKSLGDAVRALDGIARDAGAAAVLASALAAEGTGLCEEVYDLILVLRE
jgi:hypothetical protein